jgi:large subunit ribosomal protein L23
MVRGQEVMSLVIYPRVSEKSYAVAGTENTYVFNVPVSANKIEVKNAVESQFSVNVETVNIIKMVGKTKRTVKKDGRRIYGKRSDYKKAYVKVKKGQTIPVFAAEEESK